MTVIKTTVRSLDIGSGHGKEAIIRIYIKKD